MIRFTLIAILILQSQRCWSKRDGSHLMVHKYMVIAYSTRFSSAYRVKCSSGATDSSPAGKISLQAENRQTTSLISVSHSHIFECTCRRTYEPFPFSGHASADINNHEPYGQRLGVYRIHPL